jgi:hypothetical protein
MKEVSVEANNSNSGPASWRGPDGGKDKTYTVTLAGGIRQQVYCRVVRVEGGDLKGFDASGEIVFYSPCGAWSSYREEQEHIVREDKIDWEKLSKDAEKHNKEKEDAWRRVQPYMPYVYFQYPPKDWWKVTC